MYIPYQFKNLENKGINVDTNSEPYFYGKFYYFYYLKILYTVKRKFKKKMIVRL